MDLYVRPARASDIQGMCDLLTELFSIESDFTPDRQKQSKGLELLVSSGRGSSAVYVADNGGEIIGMCSVQVLISTSEGGRVGLLEDLVVKKGYRGKGVGRRLLSEATAWCRENKLSRVQLLRDLDNFGALKFYMSNGWADTRLACMRKFV